MRPYTRSGLLKAVAWCHVLALIICMFVPQGVARADDLYDPLRVVSSASPKSMVSPGKVKISIRMINDGDDVINAVEILDGDGNRVYGPQDLDLGGDYTWKSEVTVTRQQLDDGSIPFKVRYVIAQGTEDEKQLSKSVSVKVVKLDVSPKLEFTRSVSSQSAHPGQEITLTYTLKNTGNVKLTGISVMDTLVGEVGDVAELDTDKRVTLTSKVTINEDSSSRPTVTYSYEGGDTKSQSLSAVNIRMVKGELELELSVDKKNVREGDTIELTCRIRNNMNVDVKRVKITDGTLGDLDTLSDPIASGKSYTYRKKVKVSRDTKYQFSVSAKDATNQSVSAKSNSVSVNVASATPKPATPKPATPKPVTPRPATPRPQTPRPTAQVTPRLTPGPTLPPVTATPRLPVVLTLTATADKTQLTSVPGTVTFTIALHNDGEGAIRGIELRERNHGTIRTIETMDPGVVEYMQEYTVTGSEQFLFIARLGAEDGGREVWTNAIDIEVLAATPSPAPTPTPLPTATPEPSPAPTEAPTQSPEPSPTPAVVPPVGQTGNPLLRLTPFNTVLLALGFVLGLVVITVVALLNLRKNERKTDARGDRYSGRKRRPGSRTLSAPNRKRRG